MQSVRKFVGKIFSFILLQFKLHFFPVFKKHFLHFLFLLMLYNNLGILVKNCICFLVYLMHLVSVILAEGYYYLGEPNEIT